MKSVFATVLIFWALTGSAQVKISGQIMDKKKKPVTGASISLKDTYDGATSDSSGKFSFPTSEKGAHVLQFTGTAYTPVSKAVEIKNEDIYLNIEMQESATTLDAVVITAGSFEAGDKKQGTVLSSLDVVTTASSNGDVTGALKTLPGTQQVGETEGLFVRGGDATESKIFIDGGLVNNFFYSSKPGIPSRGRFNPFLFKGTQFSAGGYSALYGEALSSALILESNDIADRSEGSLDISVIGIGAGVQKLAKDKKSSWGATYNYTNVQPIFQVLKQNVNFTKYPEFHDGDFNFRIKTRNGLLKYYGYLSANNNGLYRADEDSAALNDYFSLKNLNTYQNLNWKTTMADGWKLNALLSFGTNKDDIVNQLWNDQKQPLIFAQPYGYAFKNNAIGIKNTNAQARLLMEKKLKGLSAYRFGAEHFYNRENVDYRDYRGAHYPYSFRDNLDAVFAELDFYLSKDLAIKTGLRAEHSELLKKWNLAPRFSMAYKLSPFSQVSFAYGNFYQRPEYRYLPMTGSNVGYAEATHYILQYQYNIKSRLLRTEVFYKDYDRLYKTALNSMGQQSVVSNLGHGNAKGIEFFWRDKKTIKNFDYWISYSYLDTKRNYLDYPTAIVPNFAAKHTASFVAKSFFVPIKTGFNVSYTLASGRPYYQLITDNTGKTTIGDRGTATPYNNISMSLNYLPFLGQKNAKAFSVLVLMVNNVFGFNNVYGYNYGAISGLKTPVLPTGKRFIFIGWFMNFGVDRTQDVINNNL